MKTREETKQVLGELAQSLDYLGRSIANAGHAAAGRYCDFNLRLAVAVLDVEIERAEKAKEILESAKKAILEGSGS